MSYNEINREGLEDEVGRKLTDQEFTIFVQDVERFIERASDIEPVSQDEVDEYIMNRAYEVGELG